MFSSRSPHASASLPRWPAFVAFIAVALLNFALPESLSLGPRWWLLLLIGLLSVPTVATHRAKKHDLNQMLGFVVNGIETLALVASLGLLVSALFRHSGSPLALLRGAAALWMSNVLIFALWYWRLDAGGPHIRDARPGHRTGAFLFPPMTLPDDDPNKDPNWSPDFVDYLFLAFNVSTALSPTDAPVLSRWAKGLMMIQALISLTIIALLAARGVNIL